VGCSTVWGALPASADFLRGALLVCIQVAVVLGAAECPWVSGDCLQEASCEGIADTSLGGLATFPARLASSLV
jgi:hypothetical protein